MKIHRVKTWPDFFERVLSLEKYFEIRKDDRGFQKGDGLILAEWDPKKANQIMVGGGMSHQHAYTGREICAMISYVTSWQQREGYVVMSLTNLEYRENHSRPFAAIRGKENKAS